jgi:hypothetical protein
MSLSGMIRQVTLYVIDLNNYSTVLIGLEQYLGSTTDFIKVDGFRGVTTVADVVGGGSDEICWR